MTVHLASRVSHVVIDNTSVSTSSTGEDNLMTYSLLQNTHTRAKLLRITASGTKTNLNGNKTLKFYFGTDNITFHPAANDEVNWRFSAEISLESASSRRCSWVGHHVSLTHGYSTFTTDDLSAGSIILKITGECAHTDDTITQTMLVIELF